MLESLLLLKLQMCYARLVRDDVDRESVLLKINALQREIDEACNLMRAEAPEGSYWKA